MGFDMMAVLLNLGYGQLKEKKSASYSFTPT
jgi:hypothetical protein